MRKELVLEICFLVQLLYNQAQWQYFKYCKEKRVFVCVCGLYSECCCGKETPHVLCGHSDTFKYAWTAR